MSGHRPVGFRALSDAPGECSSDQQSPSKLECSQPSQSAGSVQRVLAVSGKADPGDLGRFRHGNLSGSIEAPVKCGRGQRPFQPANEQFMEQPTTGSAGSMRPGTAMTVVAKMAAGTVPG